MDAEAYAESVGLFGELKQVCELRRDSWRGTVSISNKHPFVSGRSRNLELGYDDEL